MNERSTIDFSQFWDRLTEAAKHHLYKVKPKDTDSDLQNNIGLAITIFNPFSDSSHLLAKHLLLKKGHVLEGLKALPKTQCGLIKRASFPCHYHGPFIPSKIISALARTFPNITYLSYRDPTRKHLLPEICGWKKIEELEIYCDCQISDFSILRKVPSLKYLYLYEPPPDPAVFSTLKECPVPTLYIRKNRFETVPASAFSIPALKTLRFKRSIRKVKHLEIKGENKTLEILDLNSQALSEATIPKSILQLTGLFHLFLDHNNFRKIPEILLRMEHLVCLSMTKNTITNFIPTNPIKNAPNGIVLYHNKIRVLSRSLLSLNGVEGIYLRGNPLISIDPELKDAPFRLNLGIESELDGFWRELDGWTPTRLIDKIRKNITLNPSDLYHPLLPVYADFITEKCDDYEHCAPFKEFKEVVEARRKKTLPHSEFFLYL